ESSGGRYARAVASPTRAGKIALDATLRAAAPSLRARRQPPAATDGPERVRRAASVERAGRVSPDELRFKQFRRRQGALFIVALDASGSMAANRIGQAKGALAHLLRRSYVRRDRVALVTFRERDAALLLAPSRSHERARRLLDALPVGGATPLAAGLLRSLEVAERATRAGTQRVVLLVFTDARANVPLRAEEGEDRAARARRIRDELARLGASLRRAGVSSVVVDTAQRFTSGDEAAELAAALGGRRVRLPVGDAARAAAEQLAAF
ncbi:MAG TPA: VWA domain-containing protein, partial [Pyrinomonadaceae bacterium]|nr:VWA domain-containing protein [Pyrinomonadaceae bacterium]